MTGPAPAPPAGPDRRPPPWLRLRPDARLTVADRGRLLVGGHPGRLLRLSPSGAAVVQAWFRGEPVGPAPAAADLARRLLDAGIVHPVLPETVAEDGPAVTVVIPTLDGIEDLKRCLAAVRAADPDVPVVVVDDGSADGAAVRRAAARSRARLLRHPARRGAAAARNTGLAAVGTPLVAFVDHDVVVSPGWLRRLRLYFADPCVAAVAPRVTAHRPGPGWLAAYEAAHSPLDMGPRPGPIGPGRPIPFVPTATLLVRRAAVDRPFDEQLPIGEDIDMVWRLVAAGWTVRHVPDVTVAHRHRDALLAFARRRRLYARSVGLLSRRHPGALPAARVSPWLAAPWVLLAARRPAAAAAATLTTVGLLSRSLAGSAERPISLSAAIVARSLPAAGEGLARAVERVWWPPLLAAAVRTRTARLPLAVALATPALLDWLRAGRRPALPHHLAVRALDDLVSTAATWEGCVREQTAKPLLPALDIPHGRVSERRHWTASSKRTRPSDAAAAGGHRPCGEPTGTSRPHRGRSGRAAPRQIR